jgi:hypothetical protein
MAAAPALGDRFVYATRDLIIQRSRHVVLDMVPNHPAVEGTL